MIGVRGDYLFNKPFKIGSSMNAKPYAGLGYSSVTYKGSVPSDIGDIKGSGFDLHAGILASAQSIVKNLMMRMGLSYSTVSLETNYKVSPLILIPEY